MNTELDVAIAVLATIVALLFGTLFVSALVIRIRDFSQELDYIKREIIRTSGAEREYWIREKRKLWLSLLPFYRRKI